MLFMKERVGKLLNDLRSLIYLDSQVVDNYKMCQTKERFSNIDQLDTSGWESFESGRVWGGHHEFFWFETTVTIPDSFEGKCVVFEATTGVRGWDAVNPQFTIYVDGKLRQGFDVNHREIILTHSATKGQTVHIILSAFTGDNNFNLKLDTKIKVLDCKTEKYYYDVLVPYNVAKLLDDGDKTSAQIMTTLNESLNLVDLRKGACDKFYETLELAQNYMTENFYDKLSGDTEAMVYCVGHTHIDCAWLWTLAVTEDKAVRSFSTVLELMREYPEYIFMSSQPQLYKYVKKNAPDVYEEIKERVKEGRWEVEGGMFVEADCNLSSGESLVRQFMHGKQFFREEFDKDNEILWLPDVFGYSAALPQIMDKSGIKYFMTTKISWNETNKLPYDTFEWEGIDGTRILTHFIPTRDYQKEPNGHGTTYNGSINPAQVKGGWQRYSQKFLNEEVLNSFGHGDGGGGPTKEMLENQRRLAYGIPSVPKTVMSTSKQFFDVLDEKVRDNKYLPEWIGELYLEYHRGTYTSMARNKKYNRQSEFMYQNIELYSMLNKELLDVPYPQDMIHEAWETILKNQFHDILPGSSIKEVYDDSKEEYEQLISDNKALTHNVLTQLTENVDAPQHSVVVYNPNSHVASGVVEIVIPEGFNTPIILDGDKALMVQKLDASKYVFQAEQVPAKGYKTFTLKDGEVAHTASLHVSTNGMENNFLKIEFNAKGQISRIYDKEADREVLKQGECANVLMTYEDRPHNWDAWDVNNYYIEKSWEVDQVDEVTVIEDGPLRVGVKIARTYLDSKIEQCLYLEADSRRVDIKHYIDWKEDHILLKGLFPVDVHSHEATFDIQYGNVKRPTHHNTSWDAARFEVCSHKWLDLSEDDYGVSILNDCKYGSSIKNSVIGISMIKSATSPNPVADQEEHEFTISLYPHTGDWKKAQTVQEAYQLNNPLVAVVKANEGGNLPAAFSMVNVDKDNVVVEVVKKAEHGDEMIIRLYECYNRRSNVKMQLAAPIKSIVECNLLEENETAVDYTGAEVNFSIKPYEIKTFKVTF